MTARRMLLVLGSLSFNNPENRVAIATAGAMKPLLALVQSGTYGGRRVPQGRCRYWHWTTRWQYIVPAGAGRWWR